MAKLISDMVKDDITPEIARICEFAEEQFYSIILEPLNKMILDFLNNSCGLIDKKLFMAIACNCRCTENYTEEFDLPKRCLFTGIDLTPDLQGIYIQIDPYLSWLNSYEHKSSGPVALCHYIRDFYAHPPPSIQEHTPSNPNEFVKSAFYKKTLVFIRQDLKNILLKYCLVLDHVRNLKWAIVNWSKSY